jgi:uncharacterized DUF497 family protein
MEQEFEWDRDKRLRNIAKHGVDFLRIRQLFDGRPIVNTTSSRNGEQRFATIGKLGEKHYTVIWTERGDTIRLISARRARHAEERTYREVHG